MPDTAEARIEIQDELKESYLNYAMSVIVSRALPDVRDGLKPSQRRILVAMNDLGLTPQSKTRKCAKICGDTSGNYHPHGEQVIYPTLVRMAQEFTIRYPLIIGQGNFGSIDGDPPAQMRYTEAKLSAASTELLDDINEDTVDMVPNYDETRQEPTVLPSRFPNLLVNGATGIAVGMSTSIPQHNIAEICDALLIILQKPEASYDEIFKVFRGPDFPTGGIIYNRSQLRKSYEEGRGIIRIRGRVETEETRSGSNLVISEIPYGITKADLIRDLVAQVNEGKINGIADIRDESDKKGVRIVLTLTKGSDPDMLTHILYKKTKLEQSFSMNFIVLKDKTPTLLSLKGLLNEFLEHRSTVITRRSKFRLKKAEDELHIKEGILRALDVIDEIIDIIRRSQEQSEAKQKLMERFKFSEKQVGAILKITLARLTRLEKETLAREIEALKLTIKELKEIIESREKLKDVIRTEIEGLKNKFGGERKTTITDDEITEDIDIPVESKEVLVIISKKGFCKRIYTEALGTRKSFNIQETRGQDEVTVCATAFTDQIILAFSNKGQAYGFPVHKLPVSDKSGRGKNIHQLISLGDDEYISDIVTLPKPEGNIIFITAKGNIKKTPAVEFVNAKKAGIKAINLKDDELVRAIPEIKQSLIILNSDNSMLRFNLKDIRTMGRQGAGVRGMKIKQGNRVTDAILVDDSGTIILSDPNSFSKKVPLVEIREQSRGGKGIASGGATKACFAGEGLEKLVYITTSGQYNRVSVKSVPKMGRAARGKRVVKTPGCKISRIF